MNYPIYGNNNQFYMQELQGMKDKIDSQMRQLQQSQPQQLPQLTQNFQIAPQQNTNELESKYVNNIEDVKNTFVIKTGVFVNKEFTNLWVKEVTGEIKTYKLEQIIEIDEKDKEIMELKREIEELKGAMINEDDEYDYPEFDEPVAKKQPKRVQSSKRVNAK